MIKPKNMTTENTRRTFDETFKREAISHWLASGKSARVIAEELGIRSELLYAWRKIFAPEQVGKPATKPQPSADDLQAQLQAAQDEIRHLKEQRDILKKTLGILSEPPRNGSKGSMR